MADNNGTRPSMQRISRTSFVVSKLLERVESHRQTATSVQLPSPGGGDVLTDTPPPSLPMSRKGSVVFPSVELAQRSASLRRNRSALAQCVLQRRRSELTQQLTSEPGAGRRSSSGSAGASNHEGGAAETQQSVLASVAAFLHTGDVQPRRVAPLKTVATAVVMLVRMQAAVEHRRRSQALRLRDISGGCGSDDGASSSPRNPSSYPPTARGASFNGAPSSSPRPPAVHPHSAAQGGVVPPITLQAQPQQPSASTGAEGALSSAATATTEHDSPSPSIEGGGGAAANAPDVMSDGSDSNDAADDISFASWDSNDRIDDGDSVGSSEDDDGMGTAYFPHPRDIAQLPELMRSHIERRALRSLKRFLVVFRFRRYLNARRARRSPLTIASVPPAVIEGSEIFRGWTPAMLEAAFSGAYIQTWYGGTFIAYPNEPQRFVYVVLSGCATELRHRGGPTGPADADSNSTTGGDASLIPPPPSCSKKKLVLHSKDTDVVCAHQNPVVLRASAAMVQESSLADIGILAVTACTVGVISVAAVEHAFQNTAGGDGGAAAAAAFRDPSRAPLCERYKRIRQERTAVYLQEQIAETTAAIQAESSAATAAAAAMILSSVDSGSKKRIDAAVDDAAAPASNARRLPSTTTPAPCLQLNLRSSSLLQNITKEQERLLLGRLVPLSFFEGENILAKDAEDHKNLYFVLRGSMVSVSRYLDVSNTSPSHGKTTSRRRKSTAAAAGGTGAWKDMVFSRWVAGESVGDKAIYFQEPPVFTLRAETNCDLAVLKRSALLQLMESSDRSGLRQAIASGAFVVRANDPVVRLRLSSVRSIPCIEAALQEGLVTEAFVRELHARFQIHVFPATELITSSSATVKSIVVTSTGSAIVDVNGPAPFHLPIGVAIGCSVLCNVRWRYAVYATTECEGWVLPVATFVDVCRQHHVLQRMVELSMAQHQILLRTDGSDTSVFEVLTPQQVVVTELAAHGDVAAQTRLAAQLVMPSRRLLDQRSFLQKLAPDVPVPPPASLPAAAVVHTSDTAVVVVTSPRAVLAKLPNRRHQHHNGSAEGDGTAVSPATTPTPTLTALHDTSGHRGTRRTHQGDMTVHDVLGHHHHAPSSMDNSLRTPMSTASLGQATPRPADSTAPSGASLFDATVLLPESNHHVAVAAMQRAAAPQLRPDGPAPMCPGVVLVAPGERDATVVVPLPRQDGCEEGLHNAAQTAEGVDAVDDSSGCLAQKKGHRPRKQLLLTYMNMLAARASPLSMEVDDDGNAQTSCPPHAMVHPLSSLVDERHHQNRPHDPSARCDDASSSASSAHGLPQGRRHRQERSTVVAEVRYARTPPPPLSCHHLEEHHPASVEDTIRRRVFASSLSRAFTPSAYYRATRRMQATTTAFHAVSGINRAASPLPNDGAPGPNSNRNTEIVGSKAWCLASPSSQHSGEAAHQQTKSLRLAALGIVHLQSHGRSSPLARLFPTNTRLPQSSPSSSFS